MPVLHGAQRVLGAAVSAYVAAEVVRRHGRHVVPPSVGELIDLRKGVTDAEVYHRPFVQTWYRLSKGESLAAAVIAGAVRAGQIAELDMQQTYAHAVRHALRSIPRPLRAHLLAALLTGTDNCELCRRAATRLYDLDELNPSHGNCYCTVEPRWGGKPGTAEHDDVVATMGSWVQSWSGRRTTSPRELTCRDSAGPAPRDGFRVESVRARPCRLPRKGGSSRKGKAMTEPQITGVPMVPGIHTDANGTGDATPEEQPAPVLIESGTDPEGATTSTGKSRP